MRFAILTAALLAVPAASQTTAVSLAGVTNQDWSDAQSFGTIPTGNVVLGGTPFLIDDIGAGARYYFADGTNPVTLTIPVSIFGATTAYTLLNTIWGTAGVFQTVTFNATGGLSTTFSLDGNVDIRDYNQFVWTNSINGTTTQQVFTEGGLRLDRQTYVLPASFAGQTLTSVVFTDTGASNFSRMALTGLTIESGVPEPASWAMLITGFGLIGATLRRKRVAATV